MRLFLKIIAWLSIIFFAGASFCGLFFSAFLRVSSIKVLGADYLDISEVEKLVQVQLKGRHLNFIRKDNFILINTETIKTAVLREFREIEELEIRKKFPNKLVFSIKERDSAIIVCGETCYIADVAGKIYDEANLDGEENYNSQKLPILRNGANKNFQLEEAVLDSAYIQYVRGIQEKLRNDLEIEIERELFTPQLISGDIRAKTKEGWGIYFDRSVSLEKEISMLRAVLKNKIEKEKIKDLEYIDLRTDNKVYYKYKASSVDQKEQPAMEESI